jgi:hypothetical protein
MVGGFTCYFVSVTVDEDVCGLQIAVDDTMFDQLNEPVQNIEH